MTLKIILSGDGGQGIQTLSYLICNTAFKNGLEVSHIPNYGLEQKGGVSMAYIKISDKEIFYPKFSKPDFLLIMSDQARERTVDYQQDGVEIIEIKDYVDFFKENNVEPYSRNIFFLSKISGMLEGKGIIKKQEIYQALEEKLAKKRGWEENRRVWNLSTPL
ncbi:MAG: 2-oxoacid:acceptor oxidoreductase family protein [Candidatus Magasanikbacteria bacterium]